MFIYQIFSTIIFLAILPIYAVVRACKGKALPIEKFGKFSVPTNLNDSKVIMYHGVSVGEVIALENLIKKTKETFPDCKLVITTGTKTGQEIAKKKFENIADFITYFPLDITFCVKAFLDKVKPDMVFIAETELWPTFAQYCKKKNIKLFVINGRISDSTFRSYRLLKQFFKELFKNYTGIYTQSKQDMEKFVQIGAPAEITEVMKNLKFDVKKVEANFDLGEGRIIIAGSTHKGEDEIVLNSFVKLKKEFPDIKLIIAPRHLTRENEVKALVENTGLPYGLRSNNDRFDKNEIIILNTLGELSKIYQICDFAFIGGSFNKTGGHNPLEAVVYEKPAISGPSIHNFKDIYWLLTQSNAGKVVKTQDELTKYMHKLLADNEFYKTACDDCKTIFQEQKGALDFVINKIKTNV
jgi:3-deoxy-D-manno-octulosonic-acid transferase